MISNLRIVLALMTVLVPDWGRAQEPAVPVEKEAPINRKLLIEPSSTTVAAGKASLIVKPLTHKGKFYVGDYQLKVVPYFFKNEEGTLELEASDETVQKLSEGIGVKFTGKATNNKKQQDQGGYWQRHAEHRR